MHWTIKRYVFADFGALVTLTAFTLHTHTHQYSLALSAQIINKFVAAIIDV